MIVGSHSEDSVTDHDSGSDMMTVTAHQKKRQPIKSALVRSVEESRKKRSLRFQSHGIIDVEDMTAKFTTVTIREYSITIGDNPASVTGPSLSLGWTYSSEQTFLLADFEDQRPPRRKGREMILPARLRLERLQDAGFSKSEITSGTKPVNIARAQRKHTLETMQLQKLQSIGESLFRKILNLFTLGVRKRKERKFLNQYKGGVVIQQYPVVAK